MKILYVTSEVIPFSRAGGLADVSQSLPSYLGRLGHEIIVVTPKYRLPSSNKPPLKLVETALEVPISWMKKTAQIYQSSLKDQIPVYLIGQDDLFDREGLYGNEYGDYQDNAERFIFFSRAALELCKALSLKPDLIHCHDWQTGLIPVYLKTIYSQEKVLDSTASLFTIHNLGYQGLFWHYDLHLTGLGWELFTPSGLEFFGKINLMKGGIIFADLLNTVSPTYRNEILTPENGFGLEGVLKNREKDLFAVLNGVDYEVWNPSEDPLLPAHYSTAGLDRKKICKNHLQGLFQLKKKAETPIIAIISRLLDRKGLDLIGQVFPKLMELDLEVILMGHGVDHYQSWALEMVKKYPGQIALEMNYQDNLAHLIQGGADILLMPSRYEPCGLDQMYALKYGTIPIVRAVGGLDDTVEDYNPQTEQGTGFKFKEYEPDRFWLTIQRALNLFRDKPRWTRLMQRAMAQDFSWAKSAEAYQQLYRKAMEKRGTAKQVESGLQIIKKVIQVANANIEYDERLQGILEIITHRGDIQKGLLLLLAPNKEMLELKNISPRETPRPVWSIPFDKNPFADCLNNRRFLFIPRLNRKEHKNILKIPFFKGYASLLVWPVEDDNYLYGLLCLLSQEGHRQGAEDQDIFQMICRELAGVIRNSRVYTEAKKRIAELSVLYQVGKVIGSTLELEDLVKRTVAIIAQVINARGSALIITSGADPVVKIEADFGVIPPFTKGILTREILEGKGSYISPLQAPPPPAQGELPPEAHAGGTDAPASWMCAPLRFKGPYQGRLCVYGRVGTGVEAEAQFSQDDLSILSTIGNIIASSLENALTFQQLEALARKNEMMVKSLSILYQINSAMMTTASYEELLRIILESITLKEGLGFNRAILLLVDEESKKLKAVKGSVQGLETVSEKEKPETCGVGLSGWLVSKASQVSAEALALDHLIQAISVPLTKENGILAQTVLEGRVFLIKEAQKDPRTNKGLVERLGIDSFASVPIFAKDKVIGVISVDNYLDRHPIGEEDLQILSMLARQAGLAIENARLYKYIEHTNQELKSAQERLLESEKLMALGEMAAGMAHEIRNPLVSIGGFVRRLFKKFQGDSQVQTYFQVIINEVERLEKTLNEILDFSQDTEGKFKEEDVNQIVEGALELIRRELDESQITVQKELNPLPRVYCDGRQIRHVFYNLFLNALQAMPHGGVLGIRTELSKGSDPGWVMVEIRDTGGGIPPELLHNIFNPFFTTKASGSGLGLSIVHKIVTRHYGNVEIDNRPGEGVSFFIKLPLLKGSQSFFRKFKFNGEESNEKNSNRR